MPRSNLKGDLQERNRMIQEFSDIFYSIGCLPGKYIIHVDPAVLPVVHPPRWIPITLKEKFKGRAGLHGKLRHNIPSDRANVMG